jgi:hypothetical protein
MGRRRLNFGGLFVKRRLAHNIGSALAAFLFVFVLLVSAANAQDVPNTPVPPPAPVQPIPYSHQTHLALGLKCATCHVNPDPGAMMTFPATKICMQCHANIATDKPSIQKLTEYSKSQTAVPWVRVYQVLPGVEWNHRRHLKAGMKCEMCHGAVADMPVMAEVKSVTSMTGCIGCHKLHNAPATCTTCHLAWAPGMVIAKPAN